MTLASPESMLQVSLYVVPPMPPDFAPAGCRLTTMPEPASGSDRGLELAPLLETTG
jgi:hypothetical protein